MEGIKDNDDDYLLLAKATNLDFLIYGLPNVKALSLNR